MTCVCFLLFFWYSECYHVEWYNSLPPFFLNSQCSGEYLSLPSPSFPQLPNDLWWCSLARAAHLLSMSSQYFLYQIGLTVAFCINNENAYLFHDSWHKFHTSCGINNLDEIEFDTARLSLNNQVQQIKYFFNIFLQFIFLNLEHFIKAAGGAMKYVTSIIGGL